jgi:hypothetical protein
MARTWSMSFSGFDGLDRSTEKFGLLVREGGNGLGFDFSSPASVALWALTQAALSHLIEGEDLSFAALFENRGAIEAIDAIIQLAKRRACGFRNFFYLRTIANWVAGKLGVNLPFYLPT